MRRYLGIAALSLALVFGLSISNAFAQGFGYPEELELLAQQTEGTAVEKQYKVLEPVEEEEINFEEIIEGAGAGI